MARKLSYRYDIEKQEKSLSQAKCPISLTVLYQYIPRILKEIPDFDMDIYLDERNQSFQHGNHILEKHPKSKI